MDPLTLIAAGTAAVKLIESIRNMVRAGQVPSKDDPNVPMTVEAYDAEIEAARKPVRDGIDVARRELTGG